MKAMPRFYGLIAKKSKEKVPLEGVKVSAEVTGYTAQVTARMQYKNTEENPIEAIYIFPLDEQAAVCGFQATIDNRTIVAEIREKEKARDEYDDAISSGQSAFLLEESDKSSDVFKINVGNLPPHKSASVQLTFVTELEVDDEGSVKFVLPTVLNPRYTPAGHESCITTQIPASTVAKPYSFEFELSVKSGSPIKSIESPSSKLHIERDAHDKHSARVTLAESHNFKRDLEVHIHNEEAFKPHALVEAGLISGGSENSSSTGGTDSVADGFLASPVAMVNFVPGFSAQDLGCGEFIFVVDRSGSMSGSRIKNAAQTLQLFLKSLPDGCYFNIVGFGSSYETLFDESVLYTDETLDKGSRHAQGVSANLGGTDILGPLQWVYSQRAIKDVPRQMFILTDGEVTNTRQVIALVAQNASKARVFTFGIGQGASTELVKGMARAGNGAAEFVRDKDNLRVKVIKTLKRALQPCLTDLQLTWTLPKGWKALEVADALPPLFRGERMIVYGVLKNDGKSNKTKGKAIIEAFLHQRNETQRIKESVEFALPGKVTQAGESDKSVLLHRLAAKRFITSRQHGAPGAPSNKEDITRVSLAASVVSKYTSFIAVDEGSREPVRGAMVKRVVPAPQQDLLSTLQCALSMRLSADPADDTTSEEDSDSDDWSDDDRYKLPPPCPPSGGGFARPRLKGRLGMPVPPPPPPSGGAFAPPTLAGRLPMAPPPPPPQSYKAKASPPRPGAPPPPPPQSELLSSINSLSAKPRKALKKDASSSAREYRPTTDPLMSLVDLQRARGSWELTAELAGCLCATKDALLKTKPKSMTEEVWATALVLVWLSGKLSDRKDEWEMIADKGERWLKSALPAGSDYGQLMGVAYQALDI